MLASSGQRLAATLDFAAHEELLSGFPYPHELRIDVELADPRLTITTTLRATGDQPVPVSYGWHPYLTLPGVPRGMACGAARPPPGRARRARHPDRGSQPVAIEPRPLGDEEYDDLFPELAEPAVFAVEGGGRIEVAFEEGYPVAQVYAPPDQDFICFEPMTAPTNALASGDGLRHTEPGATFSAAFSIDVS